MTSDLDLPGTGGYRGLVDRLPLMVYIDGPDASSPSLYVSPQTTAMLGFDPEDWRDPDFFGRILHPEDRERVLAQIEDMARTGVRLQIEYRVLDRDGRTVWLRDEGMLVRDHNDTPVCVQGYMIDVTELKQSQALASAQAHLLELIARGAPLAAVLEQIARFVEAQADDALRASILLLDREGKRLGHGVAPSMPAFWNEAIEGVEIGPAVGSCGTAAWRRERVQVRDVATDPLWAPFRALAAQAGVAACWSTPIIATDGALLGTFALYYPVPRDPSALEGELVGIGTHLAAVAIDRDRTEASARASEERFRDLFENATEPIGTVTLDDTITEVNRAFEVVLGYSREELVGSNLSDYLTPSGVEKSRAASERKVTGAETTSNFEQEFRAKDGSTVLLEVSSRVMFDEQGTPVGIQGICRDITQRKQAETELYRLSELNRHLSLHDSLTGLPNRASFRQRVEFAIDLSRRAGPELSVLLMDLDRFKEINDTLGHHYGDLLLIELARRLQRVLRPSDCVARLGGDEFGMLVPQISAGRNDVGETIARILAALEQPFQIDGLPLHVEASIGVARFPAHGDDVDLLLQRADVAMYLAKGVGASHATYTAELDHHDTASLTLLSELPRALREHELELHYQPQVDAATGELAGIEALIRWQHPTRGWIPPVEFIPAAEKTGLVQPLTRYVIDGALGQLARWRAGGVAAPTVAVNLSMRNLHDPTLPDQVAALLAKWQLPGTSLMVEITESAISSDPAGTKEVIRRLRDLDVGVAVDDFGTGYTSLAYLARLDVTQLKIDRSFVQQMNANDDDAAIVRAIITLGHDLGLEVVAEGVETEAACRRLAGLGCDTVQGFLVSRPLPPEALQEWLCRGERGTRAA